MNGIAHVVARKELIQIGLKTWFERNARDLPWRNSKDPYLIYLSEIILQQTRIDQGTPYFLRFANEFPNIESLAAATLDRVLKEWEGLGYYSRARNLHRSARLIVELYDGVIPADFEQLRSLPGIGDYTAAAILSIAFRKPYAVLDSNVIRILTRLSAFSNEVSSSLTRKTLQVFATDLLDHKAPGRHNESIMDLGALVCRPKNPDCIHCPLNQFCLACKSGHPFGRPMDFPVKKKRARVPHYDIAVGIVLNQNEEFLIQRRAEEGMLGGLWEFPGGKRESGEMLHESCRRELREELGIDVAVGEALPPVNHAYSHFKITMYAFHCSIRSGVPISKKGLPVRWVARDKMSDYAFPKANRALFETLKIGVPLPERG